MSFFDEDSASSLSSSRELNSGTSIGTDSFNFEQNMALCKLLESTPWSHHIPIYKIVRLLAEMPGASLRELLEVLWEEIADPSSDISDGLYQSDSLTDSRGSLEGISSWSRPPPLDFSIWSFKPLDPSPSFSSSRVASSSPIAIERTSTSSCMPFVASVSPSSQSDSPSFDCGRDATSSVPLTPMLGQDSVWSDFEPPDSSLTMNSTRIERPKMTQPPKNNLRIIQTKSNELKQRLKVKTGKFCSFCYRNNESDVVVISHNLRSVVDGKPKLTCPVLRKHVCPMCNGTEDDAHTITYCPVVISGNGFKRPTPITYSLNSFRRFSTSPKSK